MNDLEEQFQRLMKKVAGDNVEYLLVVSGSKGIYEMVHSSHKDIPIMMAALLTQVAHKIHKTTPELLKEMQPFIEYGDAARKENIHVKTKTIN